MSYCSRGIRRHRLKFANFVVSKWPRWPTFGLLTIVIKWHIANVQTLAAATDKEARLLL